MAEPIARLQPMVVPEEVDIWTEDIQNPRFTPRELDLIREHTGRSFVAIIGDDDSDDRWKVLAWLKLRRDHPGLGWEQMTDVIISVHASRRADENPTTGQQTTTSPPSATTGE